MGKTPKPLVIQVHPDLANWEKVKAYAAQGHRVEIGYEMAEADIVLGPQCWLMDEQHEPYFDDAIASARAKRYPTKKGDPA